MQPLYFDTPTTGYINPLSDRSVAASNYTISGTNGTCLPYNLNRLSFCIQNLSTSGLFLKFGDGASSNSFSMILKGCTTQDDGSNLFINDYWKGSLSVSGVVATGASTLSPRYLVFELT